MLKKRASGILLHITSLPSQYGIGDLGPGAYKFVDFLKRAGQNFWQILPLNYTTAKTGYSPYNCFSAFAGNPLLISPEYLYRDGFITQEELQNRPDFPPEKVNYQQVSAWKSTLMDRAFCRFSRSSTYDYEEFVGESAYWLEDFARFMALKNYFGRCPWSEWPGKIRDRNKQALNAIFKEKTLDIERQIFQQYIFYKQYLQLKKYGEQQGIKIIGDLPIYVAYDSAEVWAHPENFQLTRVKKPRYIAGVPPDYFSRTGQLWGNPVYDWHSLEASNFGWWMERIRHNLRLFDLVRIDHFRGLIAYWRVPAHHKTAIRGKWVKVPKDKFFHELFKRFPNASLFVEDLGYITAEVREVIGKYGFPGMRVLQFGFDGDISSNPHCPHNHIENCLVYTGTHDNNTTRGWFTKEVNPQKRQRISDYLGRKISAANIHREMIRLALASVAKIAIVPMQDILGLGAEARMNYPRKTKGNWLWRMRPEQLGGIDAVKLRKMTELYGRC